MNQSTNKPLNVSKVVGSGGVSPIEVRFETLVASHNQSSSAWYKDLGIDKSDASKIRRGLVIPTKEIRIAIAQYWKVDSATIWPLDFKKWCELNDAVDGFWDKVAEVKNHG